ncbi:hypothetical protein [Nitrospirillum iridis]|uniref:General secretion pathway protein N n=1 Tax=Nitrospirillum iridis TaxID=765888 RepID=A0A7X0B0N0_9PROT|nr:hypothetical protein [Nitrospirillum iridis]MBB6252009.1 hypothetical protein [Nitrospirillum iridis]
MPPWPLPERSALALAAAGLVAGTGLALAVALAASDQPARALAPLPSLPPLAGPTPMGLSAEPGEAVRRPLFTPDRRPPPSTGGQGAPDGPDLQVTGVVTGPGGGAATGLDRRAQKPFSVRLGDDLQGWTVESVGRATLRLRRGAAVRDYSLSLPPPPTVGAPLMPSAPSPSSSPVPSRASPVQSPPNPPPLAPQQAPPQQAAPQQVDPQQLEPPPSHPPSRPPRPPP